MLASKHDMKHLLLTTIAAVVLVGCSKTEFEQKFDRTLEEINKAEKSLSGASRALRDAAEEGNMEAVKQAIANGADVNAEGGLGTPLYFASFEGHKEIVELLIAKGANVNFKDGLGNTPLHKAAFFGHKEIADLLISKGSDINEKNEKNGWHATPLVNAIIGGRKELVELLLVKGADVNAADNRRQTPLDRALRPKIANLLRKHGGKTGEELKAEGK